MIKHSIMPLVLSSTLALIISQPGESYAAKEKRTPCIAGNSGITSDATFGPVFHSQQSNWCAWEDSTDFPAQSINAMNMHFWHSGSGTVAAGTIRARACVTFWNTAGGACGTAAQNSSFTAPARVDLSPSRSQWTSSTFGHFKYITWTPIASPSNPVTLKGIWAHIP